MQANEQLRFLDSRNAVLWRYETSMAWPAFSADGVEQSGVLIDAPHVERIEHIADAEIDEDVATALQVPGVSDMQVAAISETIRAPMVTETSVPIEIWEGIVSDVDDSAMSVRLRAKMNTAIPDHTMEIDLAEVQPQDRDLVVSGAVFYLTMYRETTRRTIKNVQDIRFRREPNWTRAMVARMNKLAEELAF